MHRHDENQAEQQNQPKEGKPKRLQDKEQHGPHQVDYLTRDGMDFFHALNKPGFAPPGWLFPIVWSILYALMA